MSLLDPSSKEPLFSLVLEGVEGTNGEPDPSFYVGATKCDETNDTISNATRLSKFWIEAHTLSCLKRASFHSSVEIAYNDAMRNLLDEHDIGDDYSKRALHLDLVRNVIGGSHVCAYIASDGTVTTKSDANKNKHYRVAFCTQVVGNRKVSSGLMSVTDHQIEMVALLSGQLLTAPIHRGNATASENSAPISQAETIQLSSSSGGWFQYLTNGVNSAIDKVLTVYEGDDDCSALVRHLDQTTSGAELDDASSSVKLLLGRDVASPTNISLDNHDDNLMARGKGVIASMPVMEDYALGNADELINIAIVVTACRHLLSFTKQVKSPSVSDEGADYDIFFVGGHQGNVERVILYRNGWGACSLGSFCRQAGGYFAAGQKSVTKDNAKEKLVRYGKILSDISEREVDLLASTLCNSKYALIEKDIITLFPGGIPVNFAPCQSDHALFQIHVTKLTIQNRMVHLEQDANIAKRNAVKAQRNKMNKLAMVHMRRRKVALDELERCASILTNLDASELRLERAKNDVQIVQSFTLLKTALQDVRKSHGIENENVEELMLDIREEMDELREFGGEAIYPEVVIDENELNEEFKRLELECENEQCTEAEDEGKENNKSDGVSTEKLDVQVESGQQQEDSDASKSEAIPA
ncbi:hypothetical protein ACHAXR_009599 [Thalassiosira sp. AJA248-18]